MRHPVSIALVQIGTEPYEVEKNRTLTLDSAKEAFESGADFVVFPEMVVPGYVADARRLFSLAEPIDGPTVRSWTALAQEAGGYVCGGFCEREDEALHNTAVLVGPEGLLLHYRKLHRFENEKVAFRPGDKGLPVAHTRFGTVGICVCYDLRFLEVVRALALKGAGLILVPTAWQAGVHGGLEFLGSSILADPYGKLVGGPLSGDNEVEVVEIDMGLAELARVRSPLIAPRADRRTDVYGIAIDGRVL
jgi:N-carbamoylputrescine amidase